MRALLADKSAPAGLRIGAAPDPVPAPQEALVEVKAISFNYGDVSHARDLPDGAVSGWDSAGVVTAAAADGSGPPVGSRVVTFGPGPAWATMRAVPTGELAVLPDSVDFGAAAALPVAGLTALNALRRLGPLLDRRVVITGAAGGVGRFAVQLGALAGAHVIAVAARPERAAGLRELGAAEIVGSLAEIGEPVHGALDNVGGPDLVALWELLATDGAVISIGAASGEPTVFPAYSTVGRRRRLESFVGSATGGNGPDLAYLVDLVAAGRLDPQIGWRGDWNRAAEAAEALLTRRVNGKAVLDVT
ncbi:zinc-binding dehydrogenase [Catellatospora citrea]|uniref:Oxidoreductase n=1 Tax=Catellatospora citrea TaxID=53366 RepID=A0A8J3NX20_9ACTN|nr:zinc-binding dehydrogenase [Catellatospora citrea]RKE07213.1 NADPH:quinone reductase-like Zn-dependent oxidoreductase [Catellatospora citrea]GIF95366.1 oxidoreductase [Catellatospora citrea]